MKIINGIECKGTSGYLWGIFGRGGCIEKLWQDEDGRFQIFYTEKEATKELQKIREKYDGEEIGVVGEICLVAVDPIFYQRKPE
jgi:hypothetical protein